MSLKWLESILIILIAKMVIHLHTKHQDRFIVLIHYGVIIGVWMTFLETKYLKMYIMLMYRLILESQG